jgi:hypothetical protein
MTDNKCKFLKYDESSGGYKASFYGWSIEADSSGLTNIKVNNFDQFLDTNNLPNGKGDLENLYELIKECLEVCNPKYFETNTIAAISVTDKIKYLQEYCDKNNLKLSLDGTCGFSRECVGLIKNDHYVDYSDVSSDMLYTPPNAYHKDDCIAVLGRGDEAIGELYDWVKYIEANFTIGKTLESEYGINAQLLGFRKIIACLQPILSKA